jgi:glycosyltransferase involved in cell wall biosynthesis
MGRMMKILLINEVYGVLSTGRTVKEIQEALKKQGHNCLVAYAYGKTDDKAKNKSLRKKAGYFIIGSAADRKLHALCSRIFGLQGYFSRGATKRLIRYISREKPDIVQLGNVHGNYLHLNLLLAYLAKRKLPVVIVLHDCWFFTGRCTHYTVNACYQWCYGCSRCPNSRNTPPSWFFDRCSKIWKDKKKYFTKLDRLAVIGVSEWITDQARYSFLKNSFLIKRIYNGIDMEVFQPMEAGELRKELDIEDKFVILSVASVWNNAKGLNGFIKLAFRLKKEHERKRSEGIQEKECIILLVGNINTTIKMPENVRNIPATHSTLSLARLYNAGDVYVSLSKEESFGKTVAEALACGIPAIALSSTALPELLGEGCGHLVANNSLKGILHNIHKVRSNGREYYSDRCISYAREHFTKELCAEEYMSLYRKLLSR